jgi:hypothetical protein
MLAALVDARGCGVMNLLQVASWRSRASTACSSAASASSSTCRSARSTSSPCGGGSTTSVAPSTCSSQPEPNGLERLCRRLEPISIGALLATLVLLFGFQGQQLVQQRPLVIALLAVPILIQVYLNSGLAYLLNRCSAARIAWPGRHSVRTPQLILSRQGCEPGEQRPRRHLPPRLEHHGMGEARHDHRFDAVVGGGPPHLVGRHELVGGPA